MSNLISLSFFIGEINIPNTNQADVAERLNLFITKYEKQCLQDILGYALYKVFLSDILQQRMIDLRDGAEYTDENGETQKWEGLVHDDNQSLIANYVYWFYQKASASQTTGISTGTMKTQAGVSVSPNEKMVSSWNEFSNSVINMLSFLRAKNMEPTPVYPEFTNYQFRITANLSRHTNIFGI